MSGLHRYSITSAQLRSDSCGNNRIAFAVFRLMDQLDRGALEAQGVPPECAYSSRKSN